MHGCTLLFPDLISTGLGTSKTQSSPANALLIRFELPRELFRDVLLVTKEKAVSLIFFLVIQWKI